MLPFGLATSAISPIWSLAVLTMTRSMPDWIAANAAEVATSPYGRSLASMLRTVVPPPWPEMI